MIYRRPVHAIVAVDINSGFAKDGKIPWNIKEDMTRFRLLTSDNICIMGRKTYQDIVEMRGEKANDVVLPNRKSFVLSSTLQDITNATVIKEFNEVEYHLTSEDDQSAIFLLGGEKVFNQHLPRTDYVHMTIINHDYECDRFFPVDYLAKHFSLARVEDSSDKNMKFLTYQHNKYTQGL